MHGTIDRPAAGGWARWGTLASLCVALTLLAIKAGAFLVTGSVAILGSLADSGLDLLGSSAAFFAVRYAEKPADADHRFGHHKAEAVSALVQAMLISASALFVAVESIKRIVSPAAIEEPQIGIIVMVASLVLTIGLVVFQSVVLSRSASLVIEGDRAHYVADIISNGGVLLAVVIASQTGFARADGIAGLAAALFLAWSVRELLDKALPQVMDQELPDEERERIIALIEAETEAKGYHNLRTRRSGGRRFVQLHLDLDPEMTLREAHAIADRLERAIGDAFPDADVLVHQDPAEG